jgi:hypothetical protein
VADESRVTMPALGKPGEPCERCGAPLATDQRYCLECGTRRGAPRVEYREQVGGGGAVVPPTAGEPPPPAPPPGEDEGTQKPERDYAPLAAVGGIAILGLMLLVGVLIGKGDNGGGSAQAPITIERGASASEAEAAGEGGGSEGGGLNGGNAGSAGSGTKGGSKGAKNEGGGEPPVEASTKDLEELENETGEDAAKNALKLPDKIATPGKPPPIDKSKPPGAGEGGVTIK